MNLRQKKMVGYRPEATPAQPHRVRLKGIRDSKAISFDHGLLIDNFFGSFISLVLCVAHLATVSESGRDAKFGQDVGLQKKPDGDDQYKNPDTHPISPFLCFLLVQVNPSFHILE
jgi:hypothetical protein